MNIRQITQDQITSNADLFDCFQSLVAQDREFIHRLNRINVSQQLAFDFIDIADTDVKWETNKDLKDEIIAYIASQETYANARKNRQSRDSIEHRPYLQPLLRGLG